MFGFAFYFLMVLFIIVCIFLILIVLIQKGRGGGLASAFGGMGGNTAFGAKTGDVLTWATSIVFGIFLLLAVVLNLMANYGHSQTAGTTTSTATTEATIPIKTDSSTTDAPLVPAAPTTLPAPELP